MVQSYKLIRVWVNGATTANFLLAIGAHNVHAIHTSDTYGCKHTHAYATLTDIYPYRNRWCVLNPLRPRQNYNHFVDILKCFLNENARLSTKISLDIVPQNPFHNVSVLVQIMAWRRTGDKPIIWTNGGWSIWLVHIYASLCLNELPAYCKFISLFKIPIEIFT